MLTLNDVLAPYGIDAADAALADVEVPVLAGANRQGDVFWYPAEIPGPVVLAAVPPEGAPVVRGEATGNTHLLHAIGDCRWAPVADDSGGSVLLGYLAVADGAVAYLIHTDEHGANGIAAGTYVLHGKREQAAEIRRVAD